MHLKQLMTKKRTPLPLNQRVGQEVDQRKTDLRQEEKEDCKKLRVILEEILRLRGDLLSKMVQMEIYLRYLWKQRKIHIRRKVLKEFL